jgi:hypothetical protein
MNFDPSTHVYSEGTKIFPSVHDILGFLFPDDYSNIPQAILKKAAEFGKKIHEDISLFEKNGVVIAPESFGGKEEAFFEQYLKIKAEMGFEILDSEKMVWTEDYAGTLDLIVKYKGKKVLVDIKTVYKIHENPLIWQLSLYQNALKEKCDSAACLWIREDSAKWIDMPLKNEVECAALIKSYLSKDETMALILAKPTAATAFEEKALELLDEFVEEKRALLKIEEKVKEEETELKNAFLESGLEMWKNDDITISKVIRASSVKKEIPEDILKQYTQEKSIQVLDEVSLKKDHPEFWEEKIAKTVAIRIKEGK